MTKVVWYQIQQHEIIKTLMHYLINNRNNLHIKHVCQG